MYTSVIYQYLAVISMNLLSISYGMAITWSSSTIEILKSVDSPINNGTPMSDSQIAWTTSLLCAGGLVGCLVAGSLADIFGRKKTLLALAFPQLASWILIIMARDANFLYVSRFLAGFSAGGLFVVVPVYTAEISEDRIRGKLGSFMTLSINLGGLLGFVAGQYTSFYTFPKCALCFSIVNFVTFIFFPESPMFLLKESKLDDAVKALQFYRNSRRMSDQKLDFYKNELRKLVNTEEDRKIDTKITWKDFQYKSTKKAFLIGLMTVVLHAFCGIFVMTNYAAPIFTDASSRGSYFSPKVAAIVAGLNQFIGTYLSIFLVDRIGRKPLLSASALGTGMSLLVFGVFAYITSLGYETSEYHWVPIVAFSSTFFIAACGILPLLTVIISEFMPDKLRTFGAMFCTSVSWSLAFVLLYCFPWLKLAIGLHGCIFFFAGSCFIGSVSVLLYMPETKGKSFKEILQALES